MNQNNKTSSGLVTLVVEDLPKGILAKNFLNLERLASLNISCGDNGDGREFVALDCPPSSYGNIISQLTKYLEIPKEKVRTEYDKTPRQCRINSSYPSLKFIH